MFHQVYNALGKIARRLHMDLAMVYLTLVTVFLPAGLTFLFWGLDKDKGGMILGGAIAALLAVFLAYLAMNKAEKAHKEALIEKANRDTRLDEQHDDLMAVLEAIAKKMGVDVDSSNKENKDERK
jgi:hypothetical protein